MGKTTVGNMMRSLRIPVHESDASVHSLLKRSSPARPELETAFPRKKFPKLYDRKSGDFKRRALGDLIFHDEALRVRLESILHPYVRMDQDDFISLQRRMGHDIACLDIPLLFETGAQSRMDFTIVASAPAFLQAQRALARPGMSAKKFETILARQMPDKQKRKRADYVIETGLGHAHSMQALKGILYDIRKKSGLVEGPDSEIEVNLA